MKAAKAAVTVTVATVVLALAPAISLEAQETVTADPRTPAAQSPTQAANEARFAAMLERATFHGRWCLIRDGQLGPDQEDKYTILGATKVGGDTWLIRTRVQYGERDFVAPLPVQVKWAGDTAVIVVDKLAMPGGTRAYSARVVVHDDTYAGTWSGGEHTGLLMGVIQRDEGSDDTGPAVSER